MNLPLSSLFNVDATSFPCFTLASLGCFFGFLGDGDFLGLSVWYTEALFLVFSIKALCLLTGDGLLCLLGLDIFTFISTDCCY